MQMDQQLKRTANVDNMEYSRVRMEEGTFCNFSYIQVQPPRGIYKTVDHQNCLRFTSMTVIERLEDNPIIPRIHFGFKDIGEITSKHRMPNTVLDIIGQLTKINKLRIVQVNGESVPLRELELSNENGATVKVTIWGTFNSYFNEVEIIDRSKNEPIVVAFSSLQIYVNEVTKEITLKTYSGTRIFQDEYIPVLKEMKARFRPIPLISFNVQPYMRPPPNNGTIPRVTIKQLLSSYATMATMQMVSCEARIDGFIEAEGWFYNGCSEHLLKLRSFDGVDKCKKCGTDFVETLCYQVVVIVNDYPADDEEAAEFILFDRHIEKMIGQTAEELTAGVENIRSYFPSKISDLTGRSFIFTVKLNSDTVKKDRPNFIVTYLEDPLELTNSMNSMSEKLLPSPDTTDVEHPKQLQLENKKATQV